MDKIRVMLADDNRSVLQALSEYLNKQPDTEVVAAVTDGVEVVSTVAACAPDVLILDIIMPRQDGFMTLEKLGAADFPVKPKVLVLSGLARDEFILRAVRLGASYYMVKPFDPALTHARIVELAGSHDSPVLLAPETPEESADEQITNLFLTLGIPAHIRGYQYLREAVQMVLEDHDLINRITKELYPGIARRFDTSASKVERAMRHAIEVAWQRGRLDTVNQMYGYKVFKREQKPTNGEFIALVADKIAMRKTA